LIETPVNETQQRESQSKPGTTVRRRNLRVALLLALVALGFYAAFFFAVSHRGS